MKEFNNIITELDLKNKITENNLDISKYYWF